MKFQFHKISIVNKVCMGRNSAVAIATHYGLDGLGIESRWGEIFRTHPDGPWGPPSILYDGYWAFRGSKAARASCWPPTPSKAYGPSWPVL